MATVRDVITRACRRIGVIGIQDTLDDNTADECLDHYNELVRGMFGGLIGPRLVSVKGNDDLDVDSGDLFQCGSKAITLTLPDNPKAGDRFGVTDAQGALATYNVTIKPNGRLYEGSSANATLSTNGLSRSWFFRPDTGNWVREADAALSDTHVFPNELTGPLVSMLALYSCEQFGRAVKPTMVTNSDAGQSAFFARLGYRPDNTIGEDLQVLLANNRYFGYGGIL